MRAPIILAMDTAASPTPPVARMDEHAFAAGQSPDLAQRVPGRQIRDAERGRLAIGQRVGNADDEVGDGRQVRTERAGAEGDDALADLDRFDFGAERPVTTPTHSPPITGALPSSPGYTPMALSTSLKLRPAARTRTST